MLPAKFGSILPSSFRGEDFFKQQPIRNKNCPWHPYLLVERNEMEKLYRGPYIDAYCQVWFHLAKLFQRRRLNQRLSRACIVHLVIKKTNCSYVKTMSCSGSHLGITINIKNTKFVKDLPMIDAQFRFNQCNSFREEYISVFSPYGPVLIL